MDAHICDKCIEQAHGIVLEEIAEQTPIGVDSDLTLKKPLEIKDFLDQYIIGQDQTKKINGCSGLQSLQKIGSRR
jgi:ATP-dependent Clp protease ATP-binding subunit ClpX